MANREWGAMGTNYLRALFALGFQGFLILICIAIYAVLVQSIPTSGSIHGAIWGTAGYTVLLACAPVSYTHLSDFCYRAGNETDWPHIAGSHCRIASENGKRTHSAKSRAQQHEAIGRQRWRF